MKLRARHIIFIVTLCISALVAGLVRWPLRVQTDLNSLVNIENDAGWPIKNITDRFSSVVNIVVQSSDRMAGEITARRIRNAINSDEFPEFSILTVDVSPRNFVHMFGKYHNSIIGATDRKLLAEHKFNEITNNAVRRVESSMMPNLLPLSDDPFLLFTNYISEMGQGDSNWVVQDGLWWQYRAPYNFYMLSCDITVADNAGLSDAVTRLKSKIDSLSPESIHVYVGGAPVHTAEMYNRTKLEMGIISILALVAVLVLNYMLFRRMITLVPIGLSLLVGYLSGAVALFLCFGTAHILTFVFGTSLIGLGIDYGFHFMCVPRGADRAAIHRSIWHSLITTLICFAPLLFASVDLLRQVAVFTMVGLSAIYLFVKWFAVEVPYKAPKLKCMRPVHAKYRPVILGVIMVFIIGACAFARIENNMAALYRPGGELLASEKIIGELNQSSGTEFLVVRGRNIQEVLETEESVRDSGVSFFSISSVIPSVRRQAENNKLVAELYKYQAKSVKRALGLRKLPKFAVVEPLGLDNPDISAVRAQIEKFLVETDGYMYSVSSVPAGTTVTNENVRVFSPSAQMQQQMARFSNEVYYLLIICAGVLVICLAIMYGRRAFRYLVPPLFGLGMAIALLTIFGVPMTFFHLLGLFIVIGLGLDYAIFHINMKKDTELRPVFFSFLTSFIGFGLLAFTSFFLIAALGMVLAIGIAVSYLVSLYLFRD